MGAITFAGENLLIPGDDGGILEFIEDCLPVSDTYLFGDYSLSTYNCTLPIANYTKRPRMRLNSLYWPSGATRWACGLFLVAGDELTAIVEKCRVDTGLGPTGLPLINKFGQPVTPSQFQSNPQPLILDDGETSITFEMYALTPHRINLYGIGGESLWLLPLVDVRYYWQYCNRLTGGSTATWQDLIQTALRDVLAMTGEATFRDDVPEINGTGVDQRIDLSTVSADYVLPEIDTPDGPQIPSAFDFYNIYNYSGAVRLDAAAWSIGMRVVRQFNQTGGSPPSRQLAQVQSFDDALTQHNLNTGNTDNLIAGWQNPPLVTGGANLISPVPNGVLLSPQIPAVVGIRASTLTPYYSLNPLDKPSYGAFNGFPQIQSTMDDTGVPMQFQRMVDRWAGDYYRSKRLVYDLTYAGLKSWTPTAYDDWIMYEIGSRKPDGSLKVQTRVCSHPANVCVDKQCSREIPSNCPCESYPTAYTLSIAGYTNGTCDDCADYNGDFTLVMDLTNSVPSECLYYWKSTATGGCGPLGDPVWTLSHFLSGGGEYEWRLETSGGFQTFVNTDDNCLAPFTLQSIQRGTVQSPFNPNCNGQSLIANVTPA